MTALQLPDRGLEDVLDVVGKPFPLLPIHREIAGGHGAIFQAHEVLGNLMERQSVVHGRRSPVCAVNDAFIKRVDGGQL